MPHRTEEIALKQTLNDGYGVNELIISDIDQPLQDLTDDRGNILSVNSLESLKQKQTNVIIDALNVTAFKLMISF